MRFRTFSGFLLVLSACGDSPTVNPADAGADAAPTVDASSDANVDAPKDSGLEAAAVDASDAGDRCAGPGGAFVLVNGSVALGTTDFCVAKFEMKDVNGTATSQAAGLPRVGLTELQAETACQALGAGVDLPTNEQWQTMALAIESVASNWSGGVVGTGNLPRGHSDAAPLGVLSVANEADPCDQTLDANCTAPGATFAQRRTFALPGVGLLWDVAGNASEWIKGKIAPLVTYVGWAGASTGAEKTSFGPGGTYGLGAMPEVSSSYPTYARVDSGGFADVGGQNFSSGSIWVRGGGTLLVRGSNYSGNLFLEPGASFINLGSNILDPATRVKSSQSSIEGSFGSSSTTANNDYSACGGTCPPSTTVFASDPSRGLGFMHFFQASVFQPMNAARGGQAGYGPLSGIFSTVAAANSSKTGFRCVRPAK